MKVLKVYCPRKKSETGKLCEKFEASDRLRLKVLGMSNDKEIPQMNQIFTSVDFFRDQQQ